MADMQQRSLQDFQRNTAFVVVVVFGGFALFVHLASTLVDVLVPLIWAAFFAVPLTGMIGKVESLLTISCSCFRWCWRSGPHNCTPVNFTAKTGENYLTFDDKSEEAAVVLKEHLQHPCKRLCLPSSRCCQARVRIIKVEYEAPGDGNICEEEEVNRLVSEWSYYVKETKSSTQLELYLDQEFTIPAVVKGASGEGDRKNLRGCVELDRSSGLSWFAAVVVCMSFMIFAVYVFVLATSLGVDALMESTPVYARGVEELNAFGYTHLKAWLPADVMQQLNNSTTKFANTGLPNIAQACAKDLKEVGIEMMLFMIYVLFWVFEPIPMNSNVAKLIKDYLMLKTVACLVFGVLMSGLLYFLSCPVWHIFFVLAFMFNYIPEFGFALTLVFAVPAVVLNANLTILEREYNTLILLVGSFLIKVLTANLLEIHLYTTMGGQFMHMHPLVLMALIIFFQKILGLTGMFLAIPIAAMIKYYVHTAEIPGCYRNPTLKLFEGDDFAPHKHFVTQVGREKKEKKESDEILGTKLDVEKGSDYGSTVG